MIAEEESNVTQRDGSAELRARMFLGVLLPLLKHTGTNAPPPPEGRGVDERPPATTNWGRASDEPLRPDPDRVAITPSRHVHAVQFEVRSSPIAAWIELSGPTVSRTGDGAHPSPSVRFRFRDPGAMNRFFAGKPSLPRISGAFRHPVLTLRLFRHLSRLRVLAPGGGARSPEDRALRVKLTVALAALGLSQLHRAGHPETVAFASASPERIYAWTVEETGDSSYLRVANGRTRAGLGVYAHRRPFVRFVFPTIEGAFQVFTTQASQMEAVERGWVRTEGSPEYTRKVSGLLQRLDALLLG